MSPCLYKRALNSRELEYELLYTGWNIFLKKALVGFSQIAQDHKGESAIICRHERVGENRASDTNILVLVMWPFAVAVLVETPILVDKVAWHQGASWTI